MAALSASSPPGETSTEKNPVKVEVTPQIFWGIDRFQENSPKAYDDALI